jgi:hypothetical protein
MLTVVVMLSGAHRFDMLETALASIPIESPQVTQVILRHQGGPWDWGGTLRERMESHPKVRVLEFPDRVDYAESYNRTLDRVETPWALMLPDDDFLLRGSAAAGFEALAANRSADDYGFVAFGWYYLKDGRYLASYVKRRGLNAALHYTPKMCTTLMNVKRVREIGGFDGTVGGFDDTVLFGKLAYEYDALVTATPIGVYRMHEGQESARMHSVYAPYVKALVATLGRYACSAREREEFENHLADYVQGRDRPALTLLQQLTFRLRSHPRPLDSSTVPSMRKWSSVGGGGARGRLHRLVARLSLGRFGRGCESASGGFRP